MIHEKPKRPDFQVEKKKPYQPPKVLASYDKKTLEAAMQEVGVTGGCSCGCG